MRQDQDVAQAASTSDHIADETHEHDWQLREDGYSCIWHTTVNDDGTITASDSDYADDGDGVYLVCTECDERRDVDPTKIVWL